MIKIENYTKEMSNLVIDNLIPLVKKFLISENQLNSDKVKLLRKCKLRNIYLKF